MFDRLLLIYVLVCAVALGLRYRRDGKEWWVRFSLAAGLPIIGLLLPIFWPGSRHRRNAETSHLMAIDTITRRQTNAIGIYALPQTEKEMNVVPLEEALLVNDLTTRRRMMIDLLKQDALEYLEVLGMAVSNEDTETSHYAVSAIVELKRKLTISMQELAVRCEADKNDPYLLQSYADVLRSYMRSGFLDERTLLKHNYIYSSVLGHLLELEPDSHLSYLAKIDTDIALGEFSQAEQTALRYVELCPHSENAYLSLMKVYYSLGSSERLQQALELLKRSPVRLSNQALTVVRFWSEGAPDEAETQIKS